MFIERLQYPTIEFDAEAGQDEPTLVHYFSDRADPFKAVLPLLIETGEEERVLVVASPLSEVVDETIRLYRHPDYTDSVVADEKHRAFFAAVKASLQQALASIDRIQYAPVDEDDEGGSNVLVS
jgi:aspartokinase